MGQKTTCPDCKGDGGWHVPWDINRVTGDLIEQWTRCETCEETGEVDEAEQPEETETDN